VNKKQIIWGLIFVAFISIFTYVILPYTTATGRILNGFASKYLCSSLYVGGMSEEVAMKGVSFLPIEYLTIQIDQDKKTVSSSLWGLATRTAHFYEKGNHSGCTLGGQPEFPTIEASPSIVAYDTLPWPLGNLLVIEEGQSTRVTKIQNAINQEIQKNPNHLAIVVADGNGMLAEAYGEGITRKTRLLGWSMTKTLNAILVGYLVNRGEIDVHRRLDYPEWKETKRSELTWQHLLKMTSGIDWEEDYGSSSPVTNMLYLSDNMPKAVKARTLEADPGSHWEYSSGSSNLISGAIRETVGDKRYHRLISEEVFGKVGIHSLNIETDKAGHYVMSSYAWATARDWTRIGLLMLGNGALDSVRIYSEDWADQIDNDVEFAEEGYGSQTWLNSRKVYPSLPADTYFAKGFGGQRVMVIPSLDLVITVLSGHEPDEVFDDLFGVIRKALN